MKLHWWTLLVGYLVGSFFGVMSVIGTVTGLFGKKSSAPAASATS